MKFSLGFLSGFQKFIAAGILVALVTLFFLNRRQEDKWERLKKGLAESYGESPVSPTDSPVYAIDLEGEARYKRPAWLNWWPLKPGVELQPGDLVYVSDESKVVLYFISQDSIVTLPEGTLFHVGLTVPQMSKLRTSGGVSSEIGGEPEKKVKSPLTEARFSTRVIQNPGIKKAGAPDSDPANRPPEVITDEDLKIVRNTRTLNIRYPGPNVEVYASKFPTSIPVTFEVSDRRMQLWGYLWKGKELEPQWSSVASSGFPRVPIEKPGNYVFQAMSEDELYASPPILIRAVKRGEEDYLPEPENWLEGVRVYQ
ncbi:MAG: hypothetical protein RI932_2464 [Pseudomonadota bacterium]|jgi:hypothetical protein